MIMPDTRGDPRIVLLCLKVGYLSTYEEAKMPRPAAPRFSPSIFGRRNQASPLVDVSTVQPSHLQLERNQHHPTERTQYRTNGSFP